MATTNWTKIPVHDLFPQIIKESCPGLALRDLLYKSPPSYLRKVLTEIDAKEFTAKYFFPIIIQEPHIPTKSILYHHLYRCGWLDLSAIPDNNYPYSSLTQSIISILAFCGKVDSRHEFVCEAVHLVLKYQLLQFYSLEANCIGRLLSSLSHDPTRDKAVWQVIMVFNDFRRESPIKEAIRAGDQPAIDWLRTKAPALDTLRVAPKSQQHKAGTPSRINMVRTSICFQYPFDRLRTDGLRHRIGEQLYQQDAQHNNICLGWMGIDVQVDRLV